MIMYICSKCGLLVQRNWNYYHVKSLSRKISVEAATKIKSLQWIPVIGLEIHAQINTKSKLFSSARNQFMAPPNSLVSNFDAALPGTLPVLNRKCVEAAILTGLALKCKINHKSYFDRKHYFYADLPQGYQITQFTKPVAESGEMSIPYMLDQGVKWKDITIERIQLEQDSGKSLHDHKEKISLIDLNRAGVGLMEIVTAPDFNSAKEASTFVLDLTATLQKLGTCLGRISEGNVRVDANISLHHLGEPLGIRSEVKNIAGLSALEQAINYEIKRHEKVLNEGGRIVNETREFVDHKGITVSMRDKEEFQDYRFMPEPNLPPLILYTDRNLPKNFNPKRQINVDDVRRKLPEQFPSDVRLKLISNHGLSIADTSLLMENHLGEYFLSVMEIAPDLSPITVFHWIQIQVLGLLYERNIDITQCPVTPEQLAQLLSLLEDNSLNQHYADLTFAIMKEHGGSASEIVKQNGWVLITDIGAVETLCRQAIEAQDHKILFKKYRRAEHSRPKNKKAVANVVLAVMKLSDGKVHTKIAKNVTQDLLDEYFDIYSKKNFMKQKDN